MSEEIKTEEKTEKKETFVKKLIEKPTALFITRLVLFIGLALTPTIYLFIRFRCWEFVQKFSLSGRGILACIIGVVSIYVVLRYVIFGGKWRFWKQIVQTILKITLPLALLLSILILSSEYLKELIILCGVCLGCWTIAGIINPLQEWAYKQSMEETTDIMDYWFSRIKKNKEDL